MNNETQLAKWSAAFELWFDSIETPDGMSRNLQKAHHWNGYLRAKQENEQAMKLAKFGAMVAHFQFNKGGCCEVCIQCTADEYGLFLNGSDEFAPNIEATIKGLLK